MPGDILLFSGNFAVPLESGEESEFFAFVEVTADKEGDAEVEGEFSDGEEMADETTDRELWILEESFKMEKSLLLLNSFILSRSVRLPVVSFLIFKRTSSFLLSFFKISSHSSMIIEVDWPCCLVDSAKSRR